MLLPQRHETAVAHLAAYKAGFVAVPLFTLFGEEALEFRLQDSGARAIVTDEEGAAKIAHLRDRLPGLRVVLCADGPAQGARDFRAALERASDRFETVDTAAEDAAVLIYTSGTTGPPKGVQLSHHNIMVAAKTTEEIITFDPGGRVISWLPAAHIAERMAHHYLPVIFAGTITCCPNPREIVSYLPQVHPTWFFAVPRIWEKLKAGLETMLAAQPEEQRKPVEDAIHASTERVRLRQRGEPVPRELEEQVARADEQIFSKLRAMLGLDQVNSVNVGAAPTPVEVVEFFHALGIEVGELWGMSETCGAGTCNRPGEVKIGTVGPATPGTEIKIAEDGEILIKAEYVMVGYRNAPDKTAEAIDSEGWLHTGDIGEIDEDGHLKIVDRKKELIINAAGKNMSPANIEAALKTSSPLIGQVCCIGDRRPYNTALIVLDADYAPQWATQEGLDGEGLEELAREPKVREAVQAGVDEANRRLARVEQIKKFTIVPGDWAPGGDELTPTMKLKRRPIAQKYEAEIEAMYTG